jgi:hypothetical protein
MTEEKTLSPQESLELISRTIQHTRDNFRGNSTYFLLWGWLIALASFGFFGLQQFTSFQYYFLPFPILVATGIIASLLIYAKGKKAQPIESYAGYFFSRLWLVLSIGFLVIVFVSVSQKLSPFTYTLILAAIGTLSTGLNIRFNPLIIGGILFFISAIVSIYLPDAYKPLLSGFAIMGGYLVPGYLLKNSSL